MSSRDLIRVRILQGRLKKHVQNSRCESRMDCASGPKPTAANARSLREADQVGRDGHAHVVLAAHQLAADREVGLDVAAAAPACEDKFHRLARLCVGGKVMGDVQVSASNRTTFRPPFVRSLTAQGPQALEPRTYQAVVQLCDNPSVRKNAFYF